MRIHWSQRSANCLGTCHPDLQTWAHALLVAVGRELPGEDLTVVFGHRGQAEQNAAHARGASNHKWPESPHNEYPSRAVDIYVYPVPEDDGPGAHARYDAVIAIGERLTRDMGLPIKNGRHFRRLVDKVHWELPRGYKK